MSTVSVPWIRGYLDAAFDTCVYKIQIIIWRRYERWPGINVRSNDRYCLDVSVLGEPEDTSVFLIKAAPFSLFLCLALSCVFYSYNLLHALLPQRRRTLRVGAKLSASRQTSVTLEFVEHVHL